MYQSQVNEHPFKALSKLLKTEDLPSVMLFYGVESFLLDWAVKAVKKAVINPCTEALDCNGFTDEDNYSDILECCETLPMLSSKKLVIVKSDPGNFTELADYISNVPQSSLLLFVCEKLDKRKNIYKQIEKAGIVYDFCRLDKETLGGWAVKKAASLGKNLNASDAISFAEAAGYFQKDGTYGLLDFQNDIIKASALCDGSNLNYQNLLDVSGENAESDSFKLLDCAFAGNKSEAFQLLNNAIKTEMPSRQMGIILSFAGLLCSQLEIMYEARLRSLQGQSRAEIAKESGINAYRLGKAMDASARLSTARLKAALAGAYRIEEDIKGGRLEGRLAMELFIAKL